MSSQGKISVLELENLIVAANKNGVEYIKILNSNGPSTINLVVSDGNNLYGRTDTINLLEES